MIIVTQTRLICFTKKLKHIYYTVLYVSFILKKKETLALSSCSYNYQSYLQRNLKEIYKKENNSRTKYTIFEVTREIMCLNLLVVG